MRNFKFRSHRPSDPVGTISQLTREEEMKHKSPQGSSSQNLIIIGKFEHHVTIWGTDIFMFLKEKSPLISYATCQKKHLQRYSYWGSEQVTFQMPSSSHTGQIPWKKLQAQETEVTVLGTFHPDYFKCNDYLYTLHETQTSKILHKARMSNCSQLRECHCGCML